MVENVQVVIFDGAPVNWVLRKWADDLPHCQYASHVIPKIYPDLVGMWRNQLCDWFLKATTLDHILMIDADMIPCEETMELFESKLDVIGGDCVQPDGAPTHNGEIGCGCMRISRYALESMERPWFDWILTPSGLDVKHCECSHLRMRAKAAGFNPVMTGQMMHIVQAYVKPGDGEKFQLSLLANYGKPGKLK